MALSQLISRLDNEESKELQKFIMQIGSDLTTRLMFTLVKKGEISYEDLPLKELGDYPKISILSKLRELEAMNIVRSEMRKVGNRYFRTFSLIKK